MKTSFVRTARFSAVLMFVIAIVLGVAEKASAVVIYPKGAKQPVFGYLVRQDASRVVVRVLQPDGKTRELVYERAELSELLVTVAPDRLEGLDPKQPQAYLDYAEELADKRQDPEARDTALRLYLIAAHLDRAKFGRSALLGLVGLARNRDEETRFRALAFMLDPAHEKGVLKPNITPVASPTTASAPRSPLLTAVRLLRRGDFAAAKRNAERPEIKDEFALLNDSLTYEQFLEACNQATLPQETLRKLLQLELALAGVGDAAKTLPASTTTWSAGFRRHGDSAVSFPELETVTEFDPRHSKYRNGKWTEPVGF